MKEIIEQLQEWAENIGYDINNTEKWNAETSERMRQQNLICSAVGLLQNLGSNANIHTNLTITK